MNCIIIIKLLSKKIKLKIKIKALYLKLYLKIINIKMSFQIILKLGERNSLRIKHLVILKRNRNYINPILINYA